MEVNSEVWIRSNKIQLKKSNSTIPFWSSVTIVSNDVSEDGNQVIVVKDKHGNEKKFSTGDKTLDLDDIQPMNDVLDEEEVLSCDNLIDLPYLNEPEILQMLLMRYENQLMYTYTGNILIAINPLKNITPAESCSYFLQKFATDIKASAIAAIQSSETSAEGHEMSMTIAAEVPHELKNNHSIIISGASGAGKTECAKLLTQCLIDLQFTGGIENFSGFEDDLNEITVEVIDEHDSGDDNTTRNSFAVRNNALTVSSANSSALKNRRKENARRSFFRAYQLSTMEKIQHASPVLEAFANANTATTENSSRFGKYMELSFTSGGDLVGGSISTYLLENVRVTKHNTGERNFNIFYQLIAGANDNERKHWAIKKDGIYYFTNQSGTMKSDSETIASDKQKFIALKEHLAGLGLNEYSCEKIFEIVAGLLHLGEIQFSTVVALEGQTAQIIEKSTGVNHIETEESTLEESELSACARLCRVPVDELEQTLTKRSVLLNKELFTKALTPIQATNSRDALARAIFKTLFNWIVKEINSSLKPLEVESAAASAHVGILDIFGFDSFTVNSFEQLCINFANEILQQHFNMHMFKLEMQEYQLEGISFESIGFTDNQESIDCITTGIFKVLDDQCRIPNPTDKRFASQIYKELEGVTNPSYATKFTVTKAQKVLDHFCIEHFAGPVVYTTSMFIEKNLDTLPQAAFALLSHSSNTIVASATEELSSEKAILNALASPSGKASGSSRSSVGKTSGNVKSTPSMVAQLRSELAFMMSNINKTIPHYVCCITPVERASVSAKTKTTVSVDDDKSNKLFHLNTVALQLRYAGILEAVKMARLSFPNRYPHKVFYQRYWILASPHHELSKTLLQSPPSVERSHCEKLIQTLICTDSDHIQNETSLKAKVNSLTFLEKVKSNLNSNSNNYVFNLKSMIGGVLNKTGVVTGITKVFLDKQTHSLLEFYRSYLLDVCGTKIANNVFKYIISKKRRTKLRISVNILQRVIRGMLGKKRFQRYKRKQEQSATAQELEGEVDISPADITVTIVSEVFEKVLLSEASVEVPYVFPTFSVLDYKQQDSQIQDEITKLVSSTKVTDEEAVLFVDVSQIKQELSTVIKEFDSTGAFRAKALEVIDLLEDGHLLIKSDKLIPLTRSGKLFSMGRHVKTENRTSSVKSASKSITTEHIVFKPFVKLQGCLRELFELAKLEKGMMETKSKSSDHDLKLTLIGKIAQKARALYQHYTHYVTQFVKEYGNGSPFKASFKDENQYLLALVQAVESQKPLLASEKLIKSTDPTTKFPLFIPSKELLGPQHIGYNTLFASNKVHFKAISHDPGLEYAFNSLYTLLKGYKLMYPIKYLRIVGKNCSNDGKECFYQASLNFSSDNLSAITSTPLLKEKLQVITTKSSNPNNTQAVAIASLDSISPTDFTFFMMSSLLCETIDLRSENIMVNAGDRTNRTSIVEAASATGSTSHSSLLGISIDDIMSSSIFGRNSKKGAFNVLYLLPQMDQPISSALNSILSAPMAVESIISQWLRELYLQNKRFHHLRTIGFTSNDFTNLNIPIHLPEGFVTKLYLRLKDLRERVLDGNDISTTYQQLTHSDLLSHFNPELSKFYSDIRNQCKLNSSTSLNFMNEVYVELLNGFVSHTKQQITDDDNNAEIDQCASEFIKSINFSLILEPSLENEVTVKTAFSDIFNCISFLHSITLNSISVKQLSAMFSPLISVAKKISSTQNKLLQTQLGSKNSGSPRSIFPHIALKNIKLSGTSAYKAAIMESDIVHELKTYLAIKISFGD